MNIHKQGAGLFLLAAILMDPSHRKTGKEEGPKQRICQSPCDAKVYRNFQKISLPVHRAKARVKKPLHPVSTFLTSTFCKEKANAKAL